MRFVPTLFHGFADYVVGLMVLGMPFYYGWSGTQRTPLVLLGALVILYSLLTDYELGLIRVLRIRFHLLLDGVFAVARFLLPPLLALPQYARGPIYVIGFLALALAFVTQIRAQGTHSHASV
jgi:hypothetical protein